MTSGIYTLEFSDGSTYIGKAVDIERRWAQHNDNFLKGKAATKLQAKYDRYGSPKYTVAHEIHADHIDLLESILIANNRGNPALLNTTSGHKLDPGAADTICKHYSLLTESTADHLEKIVDYASTMIKMQTEIENTNRKLKHLRDNGMLLPDEIEDEIKHLKQFKAKYDKYAKLNWFERIFTHITNV
jgi:hypothetical protein